MGHSLGLSGAQGRIKVGYQVAAELGAFRLTPCGPGEWSFTAAITQVDAFWISQDTGRTLELHVGQQRWVWRTVTLVVDGHTVTGTASGRPERR